MRARRGVSRCLRVSRESWEGWDGREICVYRTNYVCVLMWREYEDREWATCEYMEGWDGLCVVGVENLELKLNVTAEADWPRRGDCW